MQNLPKETTKPHTKWQAVWQYKWLYFWILMAAVCGVCIYFFKGPSFAVDFAGGYLIELSLSVDNLFVFLLIFISFGIDEHAQHRVLSYGIAGTIILRLLFIVIGVSLVNRFEWILYIFGALLIVSAVKMVKDDDDKDPHEGFFFKLFTKILPMSHDYVEEKFFVRNDGTVKVANKGKHLKKSRWLVTPLMIVLLVIVFSDILFAIDSVPAVLSMTRDLFIVYSSNIFAILGLRQMFFILEHMHEKFAYVKYGVAVILAFTGVKMLIEIFGLHVENWISIIVICVILITSIIISMLVARDQAKKQAQEAREERAQKREEIRDAFKDM